jgi:hypothetical protein
MSFAPTFGSCQKKTLKTTILGLLSVVFFFALEPLPVDAQKRFSRSYPAGQHIRLQLTNRSGTVTVEGWDRQEIRISAYLEAPAANIEPRSLSGTIVIDLVQDNQGRPDVGNVNFTINVPYTALVDIETKIGNLSVSNVRGSLVRAHISSEGDITLTNIASSAVSAQNGIGDIFFDGDLRSGGSYRFISVKGTINLRIPFNSSFKLIATAPSTRSIDLGPFNGGGMRIVGDGRRIVGQSGSGEATINVMNQRGNIAFIRR